MERVKGIEPSSQAWEAHVLPLNHTRNVWSGYLFNRISRESKFVSSTAMNVGSASPEAADDVIVDDTDSLHPGIDDHGADEFEAALLQCHGDRFGERGLCWNIARFFRRVPDRLAACHGPDES